MGFNCQKRGLQIDVEGAVGVITNESAESSVYGKGATSGESVTYKACPTNALAGLGEPVFSVLRTPSSARSELDVRERVRVVEVAQKPLGRGDSVTTRLRRPRDLNKLVGARVPMSDDTVLESEGRKHVFDAVDEVIFKRKGL